MRPNGLIGIQRLSRQWLRNQGTWLRRRPPSSQFSAPKALMARSAAPIPRAVCSEGCAVSEELRTGAKRIGAWRVGYNSATTEKKDVQKAERQDCSHHRRHRRDWIGYGKAIRQGGRSEEHTSELQSHLNLVCRLLLEKKKQTNSTAFNYRTRPPHTARHRL